MSELLILGSRSGTEPYKIAHQTSMVLSVNGSSYFFDAGENCAHTAYLCGVDVTKIKAVFITHRHFDHIGGLPYLLWVIRKMNHHYSQPFDGLSLYVPDLRIAHHAVEGILLDENLTEPPFTVDAQLLHEGVVFRDENLTVTAVRSSHFPANADGTPQAFSFLVETCGKKIVISGDVGDPHDLDSLFAAGCDALFMETGHHKVEDVCHYTGQVGAGKLYFYHHGREILNNREDALSRVKAIRPDAEFCYDGMTIPL